MPAVLTTDVLASLPSPWPVDPLPDIRRELAVGVRTLVILDDDPTGTQTVHDVPVVTTWDEETLTAELAAGPAGFFILTNSRALPAPAARALTLELASNLGRAATRTRRPVTLASRSDSTLRGHFPVETDALAEVAGPFDATVIIPFFEAGGRLTVNDVHYVAEQQHVVPAAETPFARDAVFGYRNSNLREWVSEKTQGRVPATAVASISLADLRQGGPEHVAAILRTLPAGSVCIVNACTRRDAEVFALGSLLAERSGRRLLYRTAASFISARLGQAPLPPLSAAAASPGASRGGLVVVGSYVPKSTAQLARLRATCTIDAVELEVTALLDDSRREPCIRSAHTAIASALAAGRDVVLFTSRDLITVEDAAANLSVGQSVSDALIDVVRRLEVQPRFLIAKGGITSSDVATKALNVRRALVRGQLLPGVPMWRLGAEARFPGLDYIVFPGNVGDDSALAEAVAKLGWKP